MVVLNAFPGQYAERGAMIEAEERDARLDTPILVAQLSFPDMPTMLHLFEPRYVSTPPSLLLGFVVNGETFDSVSDLRTLSAQIFSRSSSKS